MELGWILLLTVSLANAQDRTTLDFLTLSACQSAGAALAKELGRPTPKGLPAVSAICVDRATGEMFWALPTAVGPVR